MTDFSRRDLFKIGAGAAAGTAAIATGLGDAAAQAQWTIKPEKNASLRVMRPSRFVQGDETLFLANTKKYEEQSGVKVRVDSEGWEDLVPKSAVAANVGKGPDIVYGWHDNAHQFPDKLVNMNDVAKYLGDKYGGWYPLAEKYGKRGNNWISIPLGAAGATINYRKSHVQAAGFGEVPKDFPNFLKLCQALKAKGTPSGFALGNAVGDGNGFCHWLLWGHGAKMVNEKDQVTLNSPETVAALEYAKQLYETFIPGTLSWLDPSNNKAFLDGQISLTANGISIYYAAKTSNDAQIKAMVEDIEHAPWPIGPLGKASASCTMVPAMVFRYSKFPNAAKDYIRFMMEQEQFGAWLEASIGYWGHPLKAYESNKIWTVDRKHTPYRDVIKDSLWLGYAGSLGYASAGALADYIVVNMFASVCSGQKTPKDAAAEGQKRAERYYKV
jgi:multiple sugar transport system substrate-binding protein